MKPRKRLMTSRRRKGFTLIELLVVIEVISIIVAIALPNIISARRAANEAACIGDLRDMNAALIQWRARGVGYPTDLTALKNANLLDPALAAATGAGTARQGYWYVYSAFTSTQYTIVEKPISTLGTRMFYTDESGVIFYALSTATDPSTTNTDYSGTAPSASWTQIGN